MSGPVAADILKVEGFEKPVDVEDRRPLSRNQSVFGLCLR